MTDRTGDSVILHTTNAVCWGCQGDDSEANYVEAFGYAPDQAAAGATPSLGGSDG